MTARIDVVSIFPEYLAPLDLSLVGKARQRGLVDIAVHDLREVTTDRHRTVDDTPFGGGAGMVMRPDIWGESLDRVLDGAVTSGGRVLLVPTPAGTPFTQRTAEELAAVLEQGGHIVVACGRYEGIDARVAEHYASREDVQVREVSIGDYVLNGGEVAALVVIEAVVRLLPGVLGNAASVVEESHGAEGLLEHPAYTQPPSWRSLDVPEILRSGDHGRIARWRRDRAVERTARVRPDLLAAHPVTVRRARRGDAQALADVAAATFRLACPPDMPRADIDAFVREQLSLERFRASLKDRTRWLYLAEVAGAVVGYTMSIEGEPSDPEIAEAVPTRPTAELSKCYVRPELHRTGAAAALMEATLEEARTRGLPGIWLGVNGQNERAKRFYGKHGFERVGGRTFTVGTRRESDDVMYRTL
ncbi:tRNA (guanosine(37)-N1)-methyltransferase TrmD [Pseudactinotalea sp.]|uniref:tRNA (guanosine(37)-N1)-methyltransferase TrmD n=1 Tax=Pseudactinotalea sp. TaxID=1926260 RepID=UPI003B3B4684